MSDTTRRSHPAPDSIDLDSPPPPAVATAAPTRTDTVRDAIHAGACVLAGVLVTIGFAVDPASDVGDDGAELLAIVADGPNRFYWANVTAAIGLVLIAAVGLAVLRLVRDRGRAVATVGGVMTMIGATAAASGIFMYGAIVTAMAESDQDQAVMAALSEELNDSVRPGLAFFVGFTVLFLGLVVTVAALLKSRAVARWVPAVLAAGVVAVFALGETSASIIGDLLLTAAFIGIGLSLWRATSGAARS